MMIIFNILPGEAKTKTTSIFGSNDE